MAAPSALRVVPLGGLGEVGMNCLALDAEGKILIIDAGVSFGSEETGVDVVHPDFSWLAENAERVVGVFLTHGHEDHIGALPYLLRDVDVPVCGPEHALRLARIRLQEHSRWSSATRFVQAARGQRCELGPFRVEPVRVSHSIVDATALHVEVGESSVIHSGDFKFDPEPSDGEPTDEARLRELGEAGVDLLMSDSTNVDRDADGGSEAMVKLHLEELVLAAPGRVVIALFASNVQRLISLGQIAVASGRKICLLGRSLRRHVEVATAIGRLHWPSNLCVAPEQLASLPHGSTLILAGGTQGEARSATSRLARRDHPALDLTPDDTVIFSSRIIPGNDRAVFETLSGLYRIGVKVITRNSHPDVHVSGHATRREQARMIELVKPKAFLPLHGTAHHLVRHAELARSLGVPEVMWAENGTIVELRDGKLRRLGRVPVGRVHVDLGGDVLAAAEIKERAQLGAAGACVVTLAVEATGRRVSPAQVRVLGFPGASEPGTAPALARDVERVYDAESSAWLRRGRRIESELEIWLRRSLEKRHGARPIIEVLVLRAALQR